MRDPIPYYMLMLDKVRKMTPQFDVLHFHIDQFHFPIFRELAVRRQVLCDSLRVSRREALARLKFQLRRLFCGAAIVSF
jgi:hypothetical protein